MHLGSHSEYTSTYSIPYSSSSALNTLDIHVPRDSLSLGDPKILKYWILFIHGGAWRDPSNTSKDILPTLAYLSPSKYPIAGIVSINYRLTRYPTHETNPSLPEDTTRNVTHPKHIEDVLTAIQWAQKEYRFGSNYILTGHSCGATLAFQAVMGIWDPQKLAETSEGLTLPDGVIGFEGIYDLELLLETHKEIPIYRSFLEDTFGADHSKWLAASPSGGQFSKTWPNGKVAMLAQSPDDVLVDWIQTSRMGDHLWKERVPGRSDGILKLKGSHRDIWFLGEELAKGIQHAFTILLDA